MLWHKESCSVSSGKVSFKFFLLYLFVNLRVVFFNTQLRKIIGESWWIEHGIL